MNLPLFIARRYLFAKKSHNVINIISAISAVGMAIGTAALIVILSVYNGFDLIIKESLSTVEPDILVTPAAGKVFIPDHEAFDWAYGQSSIATICSVLSESVYISYGNKNGVARAMGVDKVYEEESPLSGKIITGDFKLHRGDVKLAVVGSGLAASMDINPRFVDGIEIFFPDASKKFSAANPAASLNKVKAWPSGIVSVSKNIDDELIVLPIETMRQLLGHESEVSSLELRFREDTDKRERTRVLKELEKRLGDDFKVRDRFQQNETVYKMMRYEKAAIFLILFFVIVIIAFNIFGSLTMLIIEKTEDIRTLRCLGAEPSVIRRIFILEGWMISLLGLASGLLCGIALVLLQQQFGIIKMPGSFAVAAYPVVLQLSDLLVTALSVAAIAYVIALLPARTSDPRQEDVQESDSRA